MRLRKPDWFKVPLSNTTAFQVHRTLRDLYLHTVCREAGCPNIGECFNQGTATFLILGEVCTRNCRFCAIDSGKSPADPDPEEPMRIAEAVRKMKLQHCVITGVNRDDLPDGGAEHYAETIRQVRNLNPNVTIEALTGDFNGLETSLITVLNSSPDVFNHNLETVERLTPLIRDKRADYRISLEILRKAKPLRPDILTKSGLIIGLGESFKEIIAALQDLREADCGGVTIGQYIAPSSEHTPVVKYYTPAEFQMLGERAKEMGFIGIASGPLVRSSYHAADFFHLPLL